MEGQLYLAGYGRAAEENENKLLMLRKHKIKHRGMMMELASWLVLTKMTGLMANRAGNEPS